ncbi:two-component system response regulator YesN [Paenibacillus endophyticus]|uniref:Two-component system response regulator YesN n=1 Tax=Paenibacillus endophyticus TaxID=1294268 RepID=A0A7W5C5X8_9BACL|nr:response regulator [Paenibacillus endophyticus]MBB3150694.1 two-component system response regulator YesN [Paenibacillus endophyticus]
MLNVLLVDDDLPMLSKLKNMMNWEAHGFLLCGEANGGQAAVKLLHERNPEIVITDMSMPGMDGLALINYIAEQFPHTQVIAISSYSDVHYVKNSMRKGAVDYILKHELDARILQAALAGAKELLAKEQEAQEKTIHMQKQLQQNQTTLLREFIRDLVQHSYGSEEELLLKADKLDVTLNLRMLTVVVAEWDSRRKLEDRFDAKELAFMNGSFMDITDNILADTGNAYMTPVENGKFAFVFSFDTNSRFIWHTIISEALSRIRVSAKRQLNLVISCSVSDMCSKVETLPSYYKDADKALQERFYEGGDVVIWPGLQRKEASSVNFSVDVKLEKQLLSLLATLNEEELIFQIEELFARMGKARAPHKTTQMVAVELIHLVNRKSKEAGIAEQDLFENDHNPYQAIGKFDTLAELKEWIVEIYRRLVQALRPFVHDTLYSDNTRRTMEWIRRHFTEPITLQEAAEVIGVNASYLSRMFKEECGQGFADYVNHVRVEQAKLLIRTGDTDLKDVVKQVGFNHYNYFFTVFKKITGTTPLEYEKQQKR